MAMMYVDHIALSRFWLEMSSSLIQLRYNGNLGLLGNGILLEVRQAQSAVLINISGYDKWMDISL